MLEGKRTKCPADVRRDLVRLAKVGRRLRRQIREQGYTFDTAAMPERKLRLRDEEAVQHGQRLVAEAEVAVRRGQCAAARDKLNAAAEFLNWAAL